MHRWLTNITDSDKSCNVHFPYITRTTDEICTCNNALNIVSNKSFVNNQEIAVVNKSRISNVHSVFFCAITWSRVQSFFFLHKSSVCISVHIASKMPGGMKVTIQYFVNWFSAVAEKKWQITSVINATMACNV